MKEALGSSMVASIDDLVPGTDSVRARITSPRRPGECPSRTRWHEDREIMRTAISPLPLDFFPPRIQTLETEFGALIRLGNERRPPEFLQTPERQGDSSPARV